MYKPYLVAKFSMLLMQGVTDQSGSPPTSESLVDRFQGQKPLFGCHESAAQLEIYIETLKGELLSTQVKRHDVGPDCPKSLVLTGSFGGVICDQEIKTG